MVLAVLEYGDHHRIGLRNAAVNQSTELQACKIVLRPWHDAHDGRAVLAGHLGWVLRYDACSLPAALIGELLRELLRTVSEGPCLAQLRLDFRQLLDRTLYGRAAQRTGVGESVLQLIDLPPA